MTQVQTLVELEQLKVWEYLGDDLRKVVMDRFEGLSGDRQQTLLTSLGKLDDYREEIIGKSNEATFIYVLQQSLLGLADELVKEVKEVKKSYFETKERLELADDEQNAEDLLGQL